MTDHISTFLHPLYNATYWRQWRDAYEGGRLFVDTYLEKFSTREEDSDFIVRKRLTYCPAFAKAAINDVKNAIFQRIADVTRIGGPQSYQRAVLGEDRGVDRRQSSMNTYIGREILPELMVIGKVGIYVDRDPLNSPTLATPTPAPYIYTYKAEDILTWTEEDRPGTFSAVLLRDYVYDIDEETGLVKTDLQERYRLLVKRPNGVLVRIFDGVKGNVISESTLSIPEIPFVCAELTGSLMADIVDYQIALLNVESSDIAYILKSNFPFYTEQTDPRLTGGSHLKRGSEEGNSTEDQVKVGSVHGRKYPVNTERPGFIAPPTEPLIASMEKQRQIKEDIRSLINLSLSNIKSRSASAESKGFDERGLEAGLSYIGLELSHVENRIARIWSLYEGTTEVAAVHYPAKYSLKTDDEILDEAEKREQRMRSIPSNTFKKEMAKQLADTLLRNKVTPETLTKIHNEIEAAKILTTDPDTIFQAHEQVICGSVDAARALGIPEESVEQAKKDHAERAARILEAQMKAAETKAAARGVPDNDADPNSADREKEESQNRDSDIDGKTKTRGKAK